MGSHFEKLEVWGLAHDLVLRIYKATAGFPTTERYGLTAQIRRAATAIPANIAEGNARNHRREYVQFCHIARASIAEVKYYVRLSRDLGMLSEEEYRSFSSDYERVWAMLQALINKLILQAGRR